MGSTYFVKCFFRAFFKVDLWCLSLRFKGNVPTYVINLDLPPSKRWDELMRDKKTEVRNAELALKLSRYKTSTQPFALRNVLKGMHVLKVHICERDNISS